MRASDRVTLIYEKCSKYLFNYVVKGEFFVLNKGLSEIEISFIEIFTISFQLDEILLQITDP